MQFIAILRVLGILLMMFSLSMLPPFFIALAYGDGGLFGFGITFLVTFFTGFLVWLPLYRYKRELKTRDGFLIVVLFWSVLSLFGCLPFDIVVPKVNFINALFESTSGLTTTGATVLTGLDHLPHAIRYYRQQLQFLGGMGIIVLAVAVLPMLGVGGMQLFRAEAPGPIKDRKLTPRITETAKTLWYIYLGLNVACAFSYWLAGMSPFDAIGESFSTVATGGFTMHDASFAYYQSNTIDYIAVFFMLMGAANFGLHYSFITRGDIFRYFSDLEFRSLLIILGVVAFLVAAVLIHYKTTRLSTQAINQAIFTVVSLGTTTGFINSRFDLWPSFVPFLIMMTAIIGGCAGSTSGGIKVIRTLLFFKQGVHELKLLIHPKAIISMHLGAQAVPTNIIQATWGFFTVFISFLFLEFILLMAFGMDVTSAIGASIATLTNAGASIGSVALSFNDISLPCKWICIISMIAGRLEIFTLLVLLTPAFWRR